MTDVGRDTFIQDWTSMVSDQFGIDQATLLGLYDRDTDVHRSEDFTRDLWKYGSARGVSGTPTAFVNGVKLDDFPFTVEDWMNLLNSLMASQYHPESFLQ